MGVETRGYDPPGRLTEQRVDAGGEVVRRAVRFDRQANVAAVEDAGGVTRYGYDAANRLVEVRRGDAVAERYEYDANGVIRVTDRGPRATGAGGRTLRTDGRTFEHDPNGYVAAVTHPDGSRWTLGYNVCGRLVRVDQPGRPPIRYSYDPLGRRLTKTVDGVVTRFLWEGSSPAAELADGEPPRVHYFSGMAPVAHWHGADRLTPITDHLGTPYTLLDDRRRVVWAAAGDVFGRPAAGKPAFYAVRFRGQVRDPETGFHYNFHRYYDPALGDYLTPDPIDLEGGANLYAYPRNPLRRDDPFGLACTRHKGLVGEEAMDNHYMGQGYDKMSTATQVNGIDAVYIHPDPNHQPRIVIAEAKYGSAGLSPGQMSNNWIDSSVRGTGYDRLTVAVGPDHAGTIRDMARANPASVSREVFNYTPPAGQPMSPIGGTNQVQNLGNYNPTRP